MGATSPWQSRVLIVDAASRLNWLFSLVSCLELESIIVWCRVFDSFLCHALDRGRDAQGTARSRRGRRVWRQNFVFLLFLLTRGRRGKREKTKPQRLTSFERLCGDYVDKTTSSCKRPRLRNSTSDGTSSSVPATAARFRAQCRLPSRDRPPSPNRPKSFSINRLRYGTVATVLSDFPEIPYRIKRVLGRRSICHVGSQQPTRAPPAHP